MQNEIENIFHKKAQQIIMFFFVLIDIISNCQIKLIEHSNKMQQHQNLLTVRDGFSIKSKSTFKAQLCKCKS